MYSSFISFQCLFQVERIHQRMQLDEDQAELRLFQEKFLEDGDLHTDYKRTRQFRWAGLEDNIEVSWMDIMNTVFYIISIRSLVQVKRRQLRE